MDEQVVKTDTIEYQTIETYAIFHNIDKSILYANSFLEKYGFKFVCINIEELERNFASLVGVQNKSISEDKIQFIENNLTVSSEFYNALINNNEFGISTILEKEVIFLKVINDFEQKVVNKGIDSNEALLQTSKLKIFVSMILLQFRLLKAGSICCTTLFQIRKNDRFVTSKLFMATGISIGSSTFSLNDNDVKVLETEFNDSFMANNLTEIALSNFNLAYEIKDEKTKFITLMTSLESIFNQGREQITHTVSRHLSLLISKNESEFTDNYYKIKELYKLRSSIVHGNKPKVNLSKAIKDLEEKVRLAINFCIKLKLDKKGLFDKLNAKGY